MRLVVHRGFVAAVVLAWLVASVVAVLVPGAGLVVVLLVSLAGLLVLTARHLHLQNRFLLRELRQRTDTTGRQPADRTKASQNELRKLSDQVAAVSRALQAVAVAVDRGPENNRRKVVRDTTTVYRQLEALTNLYSMVPVKARVPAMRGWAASPDLLLLLVDTVRAQRPRLTVECGSGVSTLWFALALRQFGVEGYVVSLEHDEQYAHHTRELLDAHRVAEFADVRVAPLETFKVGEQDWSWYSEKMWHDLDKIDLLFVDGPPGVIAKHARYPALPLLAERLAAGASVVVDDLVRADEQEVVARWRAEYPWLSEDRLNLEKVVSVLRGAPLTPVE